MGGDHDEGPPTLNVGKMYKKHDRAQFTSLYLGFKLLLLLSKWRELAFIVSNPSFLQHTFYRKKR